MDRISKYEYYLSIAKAVSLRGTCLRRNYGAVIVNNDEIISTGYTGSVRGSVNCCDYGRCKRNDLGIKSGERYELCNSVHAEANAIISAARRDVIGGAMFLYGCDMDTYKPLSEPVPCLMCKRLIINSGIESVYAVRESNGSSCIVETKVSSWK